MNDPIVLKSCRLTRARVAQVATDVRTAGRIARMVDPAAGFSYAAMTGSLQSILEALVRELAGPEVEAQVQAAFQDAYPDEDERVSA